MRSLFQFGSSAIRRFGNPATAVEPARFVAILILCVVLASCTMWKPRQNATWDSATAPAQYERLMWEAAKNGDVNEIARHLSSSYVRVGPSGRLDREATLDHLRKLRLTSYEITGLDSVAAGDDMTVTYTLVLHGTTLQTGSRDGAPEPLPEQAWHVMTVWHVAKHGWMAVAQSFTPVQP
jgi:hypothetical protein